MSILSKMRKRLPGGWNYEEFRKIRGILKQLDKEHRVNEYNKIAYDYLKFNSCLIYIFGTHEHNSRLQETIGYKWMKRHSRDNILTLGKNLRIPLLPIGSICGWNYEFRDIFSPCIFYGPCDYDYSAIESDFIEGPYEINDEVSVSEGDIVIDCGANLGTFSAVACAEGAGTVIAFEPLKNSVYEYLQVLGSQYPNLKIENYAVNDHTGTAQFDVDDVNWGGSRISDKSSNRSIEVNVISLDDYVEKNGIRRVDFIKADIEGAERHMLKGASRILKEMKPKLSICTYHYPEDPELLKSIILEANPDYVIEQGKMKLYAHVPNRI